jgi:methionine biosynthesis protein MetW
MLFPPEQSVDVATGLLKAGKEVSYCRLHAPHGHDAFLVDVKHLSEVIRAFLPWVKNMPDGPRHTATEGSGAETPRKRRPTSSEAADGGRSRCRLGINGCRCLEDVDCYVPAESIPADRRQEYMVIADIVDRGARVVDLGCGNGQLLTVLAHEKGVSGIGADIDIRHVIDVIDRGHGVFQADIDEGLAMIPDGTYDYAILGETLQVVRRPRFVLREMLRVAREGIVSFPNFGRWTHRARLLRHGRMPKGSALSYEWYDSPNIHLFTLKDFVDLCEEDDVRILDVICIPSGRVDRWLLRRGLCNLGADRVLVKVARAPGSDKE